MMHLRRRVAAEADVGQPVEPAGPVLEEEIGDVGVVRRVAAFARDMLNVVDNLSRALESLPEGARQSAEGGIKSFVDGVDLTARDLHAVDLGHTQYLLFYVVGDLLACVLGVRTAGLVLLTAYLVGTIASLYALLDALGRDPRLALLGVPLLTNSLFLLGLVQFLLGIPLMLLGWSLAMRNLREWSARRAGWLAGVALLALGSKADALGLLDRAAALRPGDAAYIADAGFAHLRAGDLEAARDRLRLASTIDAADPLTRAMAGLPGRLGMHLVR